MHKHRKMLSDWEAPYIQPLVRLIETQSRATLANWCISYSEEHILPIYEKHCPDDARPRNTLKAAREWLGGSLKPPKSIQAIRQEANAIWLAAKELDHAPAAQAAARAIGQAASTFHVVTHSTGIALYGALAVAYDRLGINAPWAELEAFAAEECGRMEAALRAVAVENEPNPAKFTWRYR